MAYRETDRVRARKAAQREHLLDCAEQMVRISGFAGLTMNSLAREAEVGVGTLYRYFESKGVLAAQVFRRATEREVAAVADAINQPGSGVERLKAALQVFVRRAESAPRLAWSLIAEPVDPVVEQERLGYRQQYAGLYQSLLEEGMATGEWPVQNAAVSAAALVGAIAESLVGPLSVRFSGEPDQQQVADWLTAFCLRAVGVEVYASGVPG